MYGDHRREPEPRPIWRWAEPATDGPAANPLTRGAIILSILAVVAGYLAFGPDADDQALVAGRLESAAGPDAEAVAPDVDLAGIAQTGGTAAEPSARPESEIALAPDPDAGGLRFETRADLQRSLATTTTTAPTTTVAPTTTAAPTTTTAAPTTVAPSTEAPVTEVPPTDAPVTEEPTAADTATGTDGTEVAAPAPEETAGDPEAPPAETSTETPTETTVAPPAAGPEGWVDAGHGVFVPPVLLAIRFCESTDNYTAANPYSSARGAYQFLTGSWAAYGHKDRYGVSRAHQATPAQQDEAAVITWQRDGTRPWNASKHCWSKRI